MKTGGITFMKYKDSMHFLSQCGLGAILISKNHNILEVNETGDKLLHGNGLLVGKSLMSVAPLFCQPENTSQYFNVDFGEYLVLCPTPEIEDLPPHTRLITFRDATNDAYLDMLMNAVNHISEAIVLCDVNGRILLFNDAAVKMESLLPQDIVGKPVAGVYTMIDGASLILPQVIDNKQPILNLRQHYKTCYGKNVEIMSNNYPIIEDNTMLGAYSVMKDWSQVDKLSKQVIELQSKLVASSKASKTHKTNKLAAKYNFDDIIYNSHSMDTMIRKCKRIAKSDSNVMIYGETGTGKELIAQSIHNASQRANGPFLAINCAAIPENLLESLLFGTEKGSYTGAERREGLFELANHGTLLLDEINSMNVSLQPKLLRVLQDGQIRRVGGATEINVDVRVLSTLNIPPVQAIEEKKLRQDLYFRLGVVNVNIPPLRERKEDIPLLAKSFILKLNHKMLRNVQEIDDKVFSLFNSYDWPGNVRELEHAIEHAMNIMPIDATVITMEYLPKHIMINQNQENNNDLKNKCFHQFNHNDNSLENQIENMEYQVLYRTLKANKGNVSKTARNLGMSRQNVQYRIKRYKIDVQALRR